MPTGKFSTTIDGSATTAEVEAAVTAAINASTMASNGLVVAADATAKVTVTYAASQGNNSPITLTKWPLVQPMPLQLISAEQHGVTLTVTSTDGTTAADINSTITDFAVGDILDSVGVGALVQVVITRALAPQ